MSVSQTPNTAYCLNQPYARVFPSPIVSSRAPLTTDKAQIGTLWVQKATNEAWILTSVVSNSATWVSVSGGSGEFSTLTVPGLTQLGFDATAAGYQVEANPTAGTLTLQCANLLTIQSVADGLDLIADTAIVLSALTSDITIGTAGGGAGFITLDSHTGAMNISTTAFANTVNVGTGAAAKTVIVGSTTAGSTLVLNTPTGTPIVAANGITATVGNITATNGNIVLSTATNLIQLPGPVNIMSGAGAPSAGLALHVGDMYINTTAASATTRIYVATAAGTWTNLTCAA